MLTQATEPVAGSALQGKVHALEYHGHEWLARLEVGVRLVDIDAVKTRSGRLASAGRAAAPGLVGGILSKLHRPPGEHRRADIVMRLDSPRGWDVGQVVSVTVDVASMYLFNAGGGRIDRVPY